MSVRNGDRAEGRLQVLDKARLLKEYSLNLLKNDSVFPKSTRWLYANPIANEVRSVSIHIRHANSIYVVTATDYKLRRTEQMMAHASVDAMYDLVEDAYLAHYISDDRCEYWVKLIKETDDCLKAWIKSDKERYKDIG